MAITLITGPANAGKAQLLLDGFCAHAARGERPILVVPTQADVEHYRRELVERGIGLGADVRRFDGLVEEIARRGGSTPRLITEQTRRWILAALAREDATVQVDLGVLQPGLLTALSRFVAELESEHVTPSRLRVALGAWRASPQWPSGRVEYVDLLDRLYERYLGVLGRLGWADPQRYTALALNALRGGSSRWRGTPVLFYGFDDLTALQLDTIETLGRVSDSPVTVSLTYQSGRVAFAGRAGAFQALLPLAREHTQLQARPDHYERRSRQALHHLERRLFEQPGARVDPAGAVRLLEGGGERAELELLAAELRDLLDDGMAAGEVAVVHRSPDSIAPLLGEVFRSFDIPYTLERALPFAHTAVGSGLLGLCRCALGDGDALDLLRWLRTPGLLERPELADRLEARLRRTGQLTAAAARSMWESEYWPLSSIDRVREASERGSLALIARIETELQRLFCAPWRGRAAVLDGDELDEARAFACALQALAELREMARATRRLVPAAADVVDLLGGLEFISGRPPTAECVLVCNPLALRARRVRALFLCGLQEGVFPASAPPQPLLSAEQRRAFTESSNLRLGAARDALASERYLLYACLSRPQERLFLSWHTATDDGSPCAASLFIEDVCDLFEESLRDGRARRALGAVAGARGSDPLANADPFLLGPLHDRLLLEELREQTVFSASALETWRSCPVRWFVERLLRAQEIDPDPEPLIRGALAHAALHDVFDGLRSRTGSGRLTPQRLDLALELLEQALEMHAEQFRLSIAPERLPGARRRLQADLERYLRRASEQESELEPKYLEIQFGFPQDGELPALDLGEGIRLRGRIDRIDVAPNNEAVVYDYKGRSAPPAAKWLAESNFQLALYMQAAEQLLGLRVLGGLYQPLAGRDLQARGALSSQAPDSVKHARGDRLPDEDFRALTAEVLDAARETAREIGSGALEPRPDTCDFGGGCRYPTICRCER